MIPEDNTGDTESLFTEIINEKSKNIMIGTIHRPPNNKFNEFENVLKTILRKVDQWDKPCYIMGDFNIDLLKRNIIAVTSRLDVLTNFVAQATRHLLINPLVQLNLRLHSLTTSFQIT